MSDNKDIETTEFPSQHSSDRTEPSTAHDTPAKTTKRESDADEKGFSEGIAIKVTNTAYLLQWAFILVNALVLVLCLITMVSLLVLLMTSEAELEAVMTQSHSHTIDFLFNLAKLGAVLLLVSLVSSALGVAAGWKSSKTLYALCAILGTFLMLSELSVLSLSHSYTDNSKSSLESLLEVLLQESYGVSRKFPSSHWDNFQSQRSCCGLSGPSDYQDLNSKWLHNNSILVSDSGKNFTRYFPTACCNATAESLGVEPTSSEYYQYCFHTPFQSAFQKGCLDDLAELARSHMWYLLLPLIFGLILEVAAVALAFGNYHQLRALKEKHKLESSA